MRNISTWGDAITLEYGKSLKDYREGKGSIPVFGTNGAIGFTKKALCNFPSVIIGRKGAYRGVHFSDKPFFVIDTAFYIKPRESVELDLKYCYYHLKTVDINGMDSGSAIPSTSREDFYNLPLDLPSLPTQKAIAEILSSLDDKIELNNQVNQNLEALAQALFKQWFVDFEFPNENGEPYKSSGGEMIESELGEIPKGWEVKSLDEIANYLNGLALQKFRPKSESEPSLPVIKIKELRQGYSGGEEKASIEIDKKYIILDGDILFSWSGSLLVDFWTGGKGALNQHLFKVTSHTYPKWFIFLWTKFHLLEFQKIAESKATTMGHIQRKHLSDAKVLVPSNSLLKKFTETFECIIEELISSRLESRKLMNLRDTLLPKLISGELEVSEASLEPTF
jgi:type I restriction enzyme, S subunit